MVMRIPPDIRQSLMSVGSIAVFAVLLVLGKTIYIYVYIGVFFALTFGYTIYRTSKMIPLMKQNAKEATRARKDAKDKVLFRQTAKDTQPFFTDYEYERLRVAKSMLKLMVIPLIFIVAIYIAIPLVLRDAFHYDLSRIELAELYVVAALASFGSTLILRRRMGLSAASFSQGTQLIYAPKAYTILDGGVVFDTPQKMPDVEFSILKFPAKLVRVDKKRNFIELETLDATTPPTIKSIRLYTKDVDRLMNIIKPKTVDSNEVRVSVESAN
jgi:uncharacterized membrane protein